MKKKMLWGALTAAWIVAGTGLTACDDDEPKTNYDGSVITIENVSTVKDFVQSGTFGIQSDGSLSSVQPGESVRFTFHAGKGQALMFAAMYAYSNDIFFAPANPGIPLYRADGTPVTGDVSAQVKLWDNGTRINEPPGPDIVHPGTPVFKNVTQIEGTDEQGNTFPAASELMKIVLTYEETQSEFTLTLTNISGATDRATPISPGVWAVSNVLNGKLVNDRPFFVPQQAASHELTQLAEDGNEEPLAEQTAGKTGIITTLSPAIVVIYTGIKNPIFEVGRKDTGIGLKLLAEKGDPSELQATLSQSPNVKKVYIVGNKPLAPGEKAEVRFEAGADEKLAYATMFGYSNDWFYANSSTLPALFAGNASEKAMLFDNGTAVSQYPGAGNAQAIFGGTPIPESVAIQEVGDTFPVPEPARIIQVTIR